MTDPHTVDPQEAVPEIRLPFLRRLLGASLFNVRVYEDVERDSSATSQAAIVVGLVAAAAAVGGARGGTGGLLAGLTSAYLGWALWSATCYLVGTRIFDGTATWGELLRTIGFAQAPGILLALAAVPELGRPLHALVYLWMIGTVFVAIRQALDLSTGRSLAAAFAGFVPYVLGKSLLEYLLGVSPIVLP